MEQAVTEQYLGRVSTTFRIYIYPKKMHESRFVKKYYRIGIASLFDGKIVYIFVDYNNIFYTLFALSS
jgi:hypothetical protein